MGAQDAPVVSVITPTYNRADLVIEAVRSVRAQTFSDFEMWIVDDGSTDDTHARLQPYLTDDPRLHYLHQPNQGQSVARNKALEQAQGEFICFLDSDDSWLPDKLERQIEVFAQNPDIDIVYGDYIFIDGQGQKIHQPNMKRYSGRITAQLLRDNCVSMNTTMARRKCFDEMGNMSGKQRVADDYDLWLRFSARYQYYYLPRRLARYRIMENQLSSDKRARFAANEAILKNFLTRYPESVTKTQARHGMGSLLARKARYHASAGERRESFQAIARALTHAPDTRTTWRALAKVLFPNLTRADIRALFHPKAS